MSRAHGTTSSPKTPAEADLSALVHHPLIVPVLSSLGSDAQLHVVGGAVRDFLSGRASYDIDLATVLRPEAVTERLTKAGFHVVETGIKHGTVTAVVSGHNVEITTFRRPASRELQAYSDTIEEDLEGRDFTINAMAVAISASRFLDPFGGLADLESGILRGVVDPGTRFVEDPLRSLRMFRFGPAAGRRIEPATLEAGRAALPSLETVSIERVRSELERILMEKDPAAALELIRDTGGLPFVLPEILPAVGFEQNEFHVEDVFDHTLSVLRGCGPDRILRLSALFHDIGKPHTLSVGEDGRRHFYKHEHAGEEIAKSAMRRLKFSNDDIRAVSSVVKHHMRPVECGPAGLRRLLRDLGPDFDTWRRLKEADKTPTMEMEDFRARMKAFDEMLAAERKRQEEAGSDRLAINGDDVMALGGIGPGKRVGEILGALREAIIERPELNEREALLELARKQLENAATHRKDD